MPNGPASGGEHDSSRPRRRPRRLASANSPSGTPTRSPPPPSHSEGLRGGRLGRRRPRRPGRRPRTGRGRASASSVRSLPGRRCAVHRRADSTGGVVPDLAPARRQSGASRGTRASRSSAPISLAQRLEVASPRAAPFEVGEASASGTSSRRVARRRKRAASSRRRGASRRGGAPAAAKAELGRVVRDGLQVAEPGQDGGRRFSPQPGRPGKPSAVSPTRASQSGIEAGGTPKCAITPASSGTCRGAGPGRRPGRRPRTATSPCPASRARPARRRARRGSGRPRWPWRRRPRTPPSARPRCRGPPPPARRAGTAPAGRGRRRRSSCSPRRVVAERLDDVVEGAGDVGHAGLEQEGEERREQPADAPTSRPAASRRGGAPKWLRKSS